MLSFIAKLWFGLSSFCGWHILYFFNAKFGVGVTVVAFDKSGKVLLLRHRFHRRNPWGLPSGWLKRNETVEDCAKREIYEETNTNVSNIRITKVISGYRLRIEFILVANIDSQHIKPDSKEVLEAELFDPDNITVNINNNHREFIKLARKAANNEPQV